MGFDLTSKRATMWDDGKTLFSATNEDDLGRAVAACLQHPVETKNKFVYADSAHRAMAQVSRPQAQFEIHEVDRLKG